VLGVDEIDPALALYRRLGFRVVGGDGEKIHMRWQRRKAT
jgi:hypothetical protein